MPHPEMALGKSIDQETTGRQDFDIVTAFEVTILAFTFLICLSIIASSLRVGITPVPSSKKARQKILTIAELAPDGIILELGSGWGHLALALANQFPHRQVVGYEISFFPWLVSILLKQLRGADNLSLKRTNFLKQKLPRAALVICYLHPGGMSKLAAKLEQEKPPIDMLISHTFALPDSRPETTFRLDDLYKSPIYVYRLEKEEGSEIEKRDVKITQADHQAAI